MDVEDQGGSNEQQAKTRPARRRRRRRSALLAAVAPALLLVVAVMQLVLAQVADLTPWKGGGFGMFSTVDWPGSRAIVLHLESGEGSATGVVPTLTVGEPEVSGTILSRAVSLPAEGLVDRAGEELTEVEWVVEDGEARPADPDEEGTAGPVERVEIVRPVVLGARAEWETLAAWEPR